MWLVTAHMQYSKAVQVLALATSFTTVVLILSVYNLTTTDW